VRMASRKRHSKVCGAIEIEAGSILIGEGKEEVARVAKGS
jgi:hypothetical protein